ncbi:MAG: hypothetical protein ACK41P_09535, partial [Asticcacaulis sp.]
MLRPAFYKRASLASWMVVAAIIAIVAMGWRLAQGPVTAGFFRNSAEAYLAALVPGGGSARVGHVQVVWFQNARGLGLLLNDVAVYDRIGRTVASAEAVDAAVALDGLPVLTLAPARVSAQGFSAVISVSPEGRYELGYEATGTPEVVAGLTEVFQHLMGPERAFAPVSYLRDINFRDGQLEFYEVGTKVAWKAAVSALTFQKQDGRLTGAFNMAVGDGTDQARLKADLKAAIGLGDAQIRADVSNFSPARFFPRTGPTQSLSALDAVIEGKGVIAYNNREGVRQADVNFVAGPGTLRFGTAQQRFDGAGIVARYDAATRTVHLSQMRLKTERASGTLKGTVRLIPEDRRKGTVASLAYDLSGEALELSLADDFEPQSLTEVSAKGRYTPEKRLIEIDQSRALLGGAPATAVGSVFQNEEGWLGAKLTARIDGDVSRDQVMTFW